MQQNDTITAWLWQDGSVKQNLIRAVDQIGQALHPSHLGQTYNFTNRGDFITHLQNYMSAESTQHITSETRALAMKACTTLVYPYSQRHTAEKN